MRAPRGVALGLIASFVAGVVANGECELSDAAADTARRGGSSEREPEGPRLAPYATLTLAGGLLAHAFVGEFLIVQSPRVVRVYRFPAKDRFDSSPVSTFHVAAPPSVAPSKLRIVSASTPRNRCSDLRRHKIVAMAGSGGATCLLRLDPRGQLSFLADVQLEGAETTWPIAGANTRGRILVSGESDAGELRWGVASTSCDDLWFAESPVDSLRLPLGAVRLSGEFTPSGDHVVLAISTEPRAEGDLSVTEVFALDKDVGSITESHHILYGHESVSSSDGSRLLNLLQLPDRSIVSLRALDQDGMPMLERATFRTVHDIQRFDNAGGYVVFRAPGMLECYSTPSSGRMDLIDKRSLAGCRHRHRASAPARWYLFGVDTLDIVTLGANGRFQTRSIRLDVARERLEFIGSVDAGPGDRFFAVTAPDSALIGIFEIDGRSTRLVHAPEAGERRTWLGFSPDGYFGLVGAGLARHGNVERPERIEVLAFSQSSSGR